MDQINPFETMNAIDKMIQVERIDDECIYFNVRYFRQVCADVNKQNLFKKKDHLKKAMEVLRKKGYYCQLLIDSAELQIFEQKTTADLTAVFKKYLASIK